MWPFYTGFTVFLKNTISCAACCKRLKLYCFALCVFQDKYSNDSNRLLPKDADQRAPVYQRMAEVRFHLAVTFCRLLFFFFDQDQYRSKTFGSLIVFLKEIFEKIYFEDNKSMKNYLGCKALIPISNLNRASRFTQFCYI